MTTTEETLEPVTDKELDAAAQLKAKRLSNAALITRRAEAAKKWQADNKKNALLFPASYDYF